MSTPEAEHEGRVETFSRRPDLELMISAAEAHLAGGQTTEIGRELLTDLLAVLYDARKRAASRRH